MLRLSASRVPGPKRKITQEEQRPGQGDGSACDAEVPGHARGQGEPEVVPVDKGQAVGDEHNRQKYGPPPVSHDVFLPVHRIRQFHKVLRPTRRARPRRHVETSIRDGDAWANVGDLDPCMALNEPARDPEHRSHAAGSGARS